jgi:predicted dehydrogenase
MINNLAFKPVRFAVVGCGLMARGTHLPNIVSSSCTELTVCCDMDENALRECQAKFHAPCITRDFHEAVNHPEVDAVIIATTESFRVPIIEAAARARKPVYTEKPLAANWDDAKRIGKLVSDSGIPFCVGHNRRCSPAMVDAQKIFSEHMQNPKPCIWRFNREGDKRINLGAIDGVAAMSIRINDDWHSWKAVHMQGQNAEIGLLLSEMTHFVDVACWFMEAEPVDVMTVATNILMHQVSIRFDGGQLVSIMSSANGSFGYPKELYEAMGHGGVVGVDHMLEVRTAGIEGAPLRKTYPMVGDLHTLVGEEGGLLGWLKKKRAACDEAAAAGDPLRSFTANPDKGHQRMLDEFVREIRGEREAVSPVVDALRATRICLAAVQSLREKRVVRVEEIV